MAGRPSFLAGTGYHWRKSRESPHLTRGSEFADDVDARGRAGGRHIMAIAGSRWRRLSIAQPKIIATMAMALPRGTETK